MRTNGRAQVFMRRFCTGVSQRNPTHSILVDICPSHSLSYSHENLQVMIRVATYLCTYNDALCSDVLARICAGTCTASRAPSCRANSISIIHLGMDFNPTVRVAPGCLAILLSIRKKCMRTVSATVFTWDSIKRLLHYHIPVNVSCAAQSELHCFTSSEMPAARVRWWMLFLFFFRQDTCI